MEVRTRYVHLKYHDQKLDEGEKNERTVNAKAKALESAYVAAGVLAATGISLYANKENSKLNKAITFLSTKIKKLVPESLKTKYADVRTKISQAEISQSAVKLKESLKEFGQKAVTSAKKGLEKVPGKVKLLAGAALAYIAYNLIHDDGKIKGDYEGCRHFNKISDAVINDLQEAKEEITGDEPEEVKPEEPAAEDIQEAKEIKEESRQEEIQESLIQELQEAQEKLSEALPE